VVNNGALVFNRSGELVVANDISGSGSLTKQGTGTVTLTGNNSYNGGTTVSQGTLVGTAGSIRGAVQVAGGATVQFNATATGEILNTIAGAGVLRLHVSTGGHTIMNNVSGFTGTIWVSNPGTPVQNKWSVTQPVSANAAVLLDSGSTMFVMAGNAVSFNKGITLSGTGNTENRGAIRLGGILGGNINLVGDTMVGGEGGTITGNITGGAAGTQTLTFAGMGSGNATISGAISDGTGTLALTQNRAGGTLTLIGDNSYSGVTTISAGTLQVGAGGATGTLGPGDVVNNGALVFNRSGELTAANRISGTGGVTKQGSGTLTLSGTSTYGGATHIQGGILRLAPPAANPVTDGLSWSLDASDGSKINAGAPAHGDLVTTWNATAGPTIGQTTTDRHPTYRTDVQNGLSVIRFDGVDDRLFSSTSHADVNTIFVVNAPAVQEGSGGKGIVGGTGEGGTASDKGIRRINGTNFWQQRSPGDGNDFAFPAGSQLRVNGVVTNAFAADEFHLATATRNDDPMKFNAVGGYYDGRAYKGDIGELLAFNRILTAAEIDAVEAYLNAKWFGVGHILPAGTAVTIDDGARLEVIGVSQNIGSLASSSGSSVLLDNSALVVGGNNASTVFAGAISGDGGLVKTGTGALTLSGASDYTGATIINRGTLLVTGALGQTAVVVADNGTLGGSGTIGGAVAVSGGGWLSPGTSAGVLSMGSLSLESGSTTLMEINGLQRGSEYDGIDIVAGSSLTYGGTLSLAFGNSGPFMDGAVFDLFNFTGGASGAFSDVTSSGFYTGTWQADDANGFSLIAGRQTLLFSHMTGELTVIPEPSAFALAVFAMAALGIRRSRSRPHCRT
jgi:autotransporter-associated beta strand protein